MERCVKLLVSIFVALICTTGVVDATVSSGDPECVYTFFVKTGTQHNSGTDAIVSVRLFNKYGEVITITNLETLGLMGTDYDYFEKRSLDIFNGRGTCLDSPVCGLNLTSDGSQSNPNWFCNDVAVNYMGSDIQCQRQLFDVAQWISATRAPYQLSVVRNNCNIAS